MGAWAALVGAWAALVGAWAALVGAWAVLVAARLVAPGLGLVEVPGLGLAGEARSGGSQRRQGWGLWKCQG